MEFANSAYWRSRLSRNVRGKRPYYLLLAVCAMLYLPGFFTAPALDPDEPVYAQSVRQMADSHDHVRLNFQDRPLGIRPPGIYWLQAGSAALFGADARIWVYRLPSLLGAIGAVLLTFLLGRLLLTPEKGLLAALFLAACPGLILAAHLAVPAAALLACILAAQTALAHISKHNQRSILPPPGWLPLIFWLALGAGILLGGLLPLLTAGGAALAIRRKDGSLRNLRGIAPLWAVLCGVLVALPWAMVIKANLPVPAPYGGGTDWLALGKTLALAALPLPAAQEVWPGFNLVWLPLLCWPALFFLLPGLQLAYRRRTRQGIFCLGWLLPLLAVAGLLPLGGPLLLLAALPPFCLLAAEFALSPERVGGGKVFRTAVLGVGYLAALIPVAAGAVMYWFLRGVQATSPAFLAAFFLLLTGLGFALTGGWFLRSGARLRLGLCAVLTALLSVPAVGELAPHGLCRLLPASGIEDCLRRDLPAGPAPSRLITLGLESPSLVFYFGRHTSVCHSAEAVANLLLTSPGDVAAVAEERRAEFLAATRERGVSLHALASFPVVQPVRFHPVRLSVFQASGAAAGGAGAVPAPAVPDFSDSAAGWDSAEGGSEGTGDVAASAVSGETRRGAER